MSDRIRLKDMTVHGCSRVEVEVDHENGCVQILCYGEGQKVLWDHFTITLFSPDDAPPELMPVTYIDPPQDEDEDEDEKESA